MKKELSNFEENHPRLLGSKREGSSKKEREALSNATGGSDCVKEAVHGHNM